MLLSIALGGALGSVMRHGLSSLVTRWLGGGVLPGFPWGILTVNVLGGLAIGILAELFALRWQAGEETRAFLIVGVLGGFTTFSAFSLEVALQIQRGELAQAALYVTTSVALSVLALFAGLYLVRNLYAAA
jgi:CrcB protein